MLCNTPQTAIHSDYLLLTLDYTFVASIFGFLEDYSERVYYTWYASVYCYQSLCFIFDSYVPDYITRGCGRGGTLVESEIGKSPLGFYLYDISIT
jgi:hypothetical protein